MYSFYSLYHSLFTLLSPPETANIFPVIDQLTRHTISGNFGRTFFVQPVVAEAEVVSWVQITTNPSYYDNSKYLSTCYHYNYIIFIIIILIMNITILASSLLLRE